LHRPRPSLGKRSHWALRLLRFVATALFVFEVVYVTGANLLLAFGGVQKMFGSTDAVKSDFLRAWTVYPGVVHVEQLRVTVMDHNVQCTIFLEKAVLTIRLRELPKKVFHATRLRGSGLSLHFRNRVQPEDAHRPYVRALPPVTGMDDPPLYEARVPEAPIPDAKYDLWTIHMDDVDVEVRELWAQQFRYLGHGRARGAFELKPARHLWVGPATLELSPGRLHSGPDAPLLADFGGRIACTVHWFDVRIPQGLEVLRHISTKLDLGGRISGAEVVRLFAAPEADVRVDQQGGRVAIHVGVDHGVIEPGSRVDVRGDSLAVRQEELELEATGPWSIVATADPAGPGGAVEAKVARATIGGVALDAPAPAARPHPAPMRIENAQATLESTSRDTAAPDWALRGARFEVGQASIPDLRLVNELSPGLPVRFAGGAGSAEGRIAIRGSKTTGRGSARIEKATAVVSDTEVRGTADARATLDELDSKEETFAFALDVKASDVSVDDAKRRAECPWGSLQSLTLGARAARARGREITGSVDASLEHAVARWGDTTLSATALIHAATAKKSAHESRLSATVRATHVRLRGGNEPRARWVAHAPDSSIEADLGWAADHVEGPVSVTANDVGATIGKVQMSGDVSARMDIAGADPRERTGQASGSVRVRNARLSSGGRHVENWWASVALGPTRVAAKDNLDLEGVATARLRDGLPGLLVLSEGDQIPGWLPSVLPLNGLSGKVGIHRHCRTTDLMLPELSGGPLKAKGRISINPDESRGAVLVQLNNATIISVGIALGGNDSGVSLLAGEGWLKKQLDAVARDQSARSGESCESPPTRECSR
jgi:hypothetical protein